MKRLYANNIVMIAVGGVIAAALHESLVDALLSAGVLVATGVLVAYLWR